MTHRRIKYIDGGSPEYWRQRTEGFRLIREADRAHERVKRASMYISGGFDEDGDAIPVENLGPWDAMDTAIRAIEANETAVDILVAQRRTEIGLWRINAVSRELEKAEAGHGADLESNPLWGPDTN
ncbi:Tiorf104 protein [Neorhizobium galegae bv. orientalis]|nr:Tiorf104 protein [Neorhizobium galegae bv. orientalis]